MNLWVRDGGWRWWWEQDEEILISRIAEVLGRTRSVEFVCAWPQVPIPRRAILMLSASVPSVVYPTARIEAQSHQVSTPCDGVPFGVAMSWHDVAIPKTPFLKQPA